jgi:hypothetical protein
MLLPKRPLSVRRRRTSRCSRCTSGRRHRGWDGESSAPNFFVWKGEGRSSSADAAVDLLLCRYRNWTYCSIAFDRRPMFNTTASHLFPMTWTSSTSARITLPCHTTCVHQRVLWSGQLLKCSTGEYMSLVSARMSVFVNYVVLVGTGNPAGERGPNMSWCTRDLHSQL